MIPQLRLALSILLLTACACSHRPKPPPSIILISIDTLRADHLATYGYDRVTSPFLDRFARRATVFRRAVSPSSWTLAAHASIFLSRYPSAHRVTSPKHRIEPSAVTLTEILRSHGYRTAGFVSSVLVSKTYGFEQGYDTYELVGERTAPELNQAARMWLQADDRPFFIFLHYYDVHEPYVRRRPGSESSCGLETPPDISPYDVMTEGVTRRFLRSVKGVEEPLRLAGVTRSTRPRALRAFHREALRMVKDAAPGAEADFMEALAMNGEMVTAEERRCLIGLYDDGIGYLDFHLEGLFADLEAMGVLDRSVVVITSDHGEDLYDHRHHRGHGRYLYESTLRVPLIVKLPGGATTPMVEETVSTIDVFPTILELAAIPRDETLHGHSLVGLMRGDGRPRSFPVVSERAHRDPDRSALVKGPWKLIREAGGVELFHLPSDPGEKNDLARDRRETAGELAAELEELLARFAASADVESERRMELDPATREELRALGYLN